MTSPIEHLRSPLQHALGYLPEGHDKALKQAFYNTAASLFAVIVCLATLAVYYILQAFLKPLLWAVLCGTFLHPFKHWLTFYVTKWLSSLRNSGTPLVIGTALLPLQVIDLATEVLGSLIFNNWKTKLYVASVVPCLYLFYNFAPWQFIIGAVSPIFYVVYSILGYFNAIWVWTLTVGYILLVIFFWNPQSSPYLRPLSVPVWIAVLLHLAGATGPFRVPIFVAVFVFMIVGFASEISEVKKKFSEDKETWVTSWAFWRILSAKNRHVSPPNSASSSMMEDSTPLEDESHKESESIEEVNADTPKATVSEGSANLENQRPKELNVSKSSVRTKCDTDDVHHDEGKKDKKLEDKVQRKRSDQCFIALFWAICLVEIWQHKHWFIALLPLLVLFMLLKKFGIFVGSLQIVREKCHALYKRMSDDSRIDVLLPKPIRGLGKLIIRGDGKIVSVLESSMDNFMTILVILIVLVGAVLVSMFMVIQFQRESMHLVSVTSNVVNNSFHPELNQWLPDNDTMQQTIDSVVGNAYKYGREYISDKAKHMLGDDNEHVEEQILHVFDQVYEKYVARNTTGNDTAVPAIDSDRHGRPALKRRNSLIDIDITNVSALWDVAKKAKDFDVNLDIWSFIQENIGVFMQVMESIWLVLRGNLSLCMSILTAIISAILGGGTAILNFVLSSVIFLTTLFYLLAASSDTYLPVEWFKLLSPPSGQGQSGNANKFGKTVEEAISSVFVASFKMAAFYGIYTWMTHTMFGVHVVYIPAALAALLAAIPFLGTYWAAFPAIIELWLVNGEGVMAVTLLLAHFLPSYFVDTAIYSDIKGGHPFMTGLAIAGGMYWLGLEGAIIGPILLCCLVVAVNVFSTMINTADTGSQPVSHQHIALERRMAMKRSFSTYND